MMPDAQAATESRGQSGSLIARLVARDGVALHELAASEGPAIHRIAYRITGDAYEAEDIAQETLLRLWQAAPRWQQGDEMIAPWLRRVATNLAIDRLRRRRRIVDGAELPERADDAPLADAMLEAQQRHDLARSLVAALPDRQRAAIVLTYYEEMSNAEAAEVMEMQIKAFESLLFRARAALRLAFEHSQGSGEA